MIQYKKIQKTEKVIEKIFCDLCHKEINDFQKSHNEYIHIKKRWGYNSYWDGETHELDICQECYKELLEEKSKRK